MLRLTIPLPQTEIGLLRWVVVALSILFLILGLRVVYFNGLNAFTFGFFFAMATLSIFLWRMHRLACSVAKFVLAMAIIILIAGTFNPFFMLDYGAEHNGAFPDWWMLAAKLLPFILATLFCYGVLDKHRAQFRQRAKAK